MQHLTVGVAMCTCNGAHFLVDQLKTIALQTHLPDQIVIFDDQSDDSTWQLLQEWAKSSVIPSAIYQNPKRMGVIQNFEQAISLMTTDIIFLCDQDDLWMDNKVERIITLFEEDPGLAMIHTDAVLIDHASVEIGTMLFGELGVTSTEQRAIQTGNGFTVLNRRNLVTGATAAFRRQFMEVAIPFSRNGYHDEWLAILAAATAKIKLVPVPTIKYRQHSSNVIGVKNFSGIAKLRDVWWQINRPNSRISIVRRGEFYNDVSRRLIGSSSCPSITMQQAQETSKFWEFRSNLPYRFFYRVFAVAFRLIKGDYKKFSISPWYDCARDLINR